MSDFPLRKTNIEKRLEYNLGLNRKNYSKNNPLSIFDADELDSGLSMNLTDLLEYDKKDGKFVLPKEVAAEIEAALAKMSGETSKTDEALETDETEKLSLTNSDNSDNKILNLLNNLFDNQTVKESIDTDKSGDLSDEEINIFLNKISSADGNSEDISIADILSAVEDIAQKSEKTESTTKDIQTASEQNLQNKNTDNIQNVQSPNKSFPSSSSSSVRGGNSSNYSSRRSSGAGKKDLSTMSENDLRAEQQKADKDTADKQKAYETALDASQKTSSNVDKAYKAYHDKLAEVDGKMAKQLEDYKTAIESQQKLVNDQDKKIAAQEGSVKSAEANYNNAKTIRENLETSKTDLENAQNDSSLSDKQKQDVKTKLEKIETEIENAQKAEEKAKKDLEIAKKTLEDYNSAREKLVTGNGGLDSLNKQMKDFQAEIAKKHSDIAQLQTEYTTAKSEDDKSKANAVSKAKADLTTSQDYVVSVQNAISKLQDRKNNVQFAANPYDEVAGARLAQQAQYVPGTYGMCLKGVSDTLSSVYGTGLGGMASAYMAIEALRGNVPGYEETASHFQEVDVPREELANLPAGAIVVWDRNYDDNGNLRGGEGLSDVSRTHGHISISLGNGQESSDHIQDQQVDRDAEYVVFYPIS